jgi:integrase
MIQVSYKLKKGRSALIAIVGRGTSRFELGTGVLVPQGVVFSAPKSLTGGNHKERNQCDADLNLWENSLRTKWDKLTAVNPLATPADLKTMISTGKQKEAGFDATLLGWINKLTSRIDKGELANETTGTQLAPSSIVSMRGFVSIIEAFILKHGDFDFGRYNSGNALLLGKPPIVNKYKTLGAEFKNYLLVECGYANETTKQIINKLKRLIRNFSKEYGISIEPELLDPLKFRVAKKNSDEDIIALDDDQFEFILNNEHLLRGSAIRAKQQDVVDYIIAGLLTCARKGDMNVWRESNLRPDGDDYHLRFVPEKTKRSSQVVVDLFPLNHRLVEIFKKNLERHGKLMPPMPRILSRAIRSIMEKHTIFDRLIVIRTAKGEFVTKKASAAFKAHSLRSSGITYLLSKGMPEMAVKKISGHSQNSESFSAYAKVLEKNKQDLYRQVFSKFTPQPHTEG